MFRVEWRFGSGVEIQNRFFRWIAAILDFRSCRISYFHSTGRPDIS